MQLKAVPFEVLLETLCYSSLQVLEETDEMGLMLWGMWERKVGVDVGYQWKIELHTRA